MISALLSTLYQCTSILTAVKCQVINHVLERLRVLHAIELINEVYAFETIQIAVRLLRVQRKPGSELIHDSNDVGSPHRDDREMRFVVYVVSQLIDN